MLLPILFVQLCPPPQFLTRICSQLTSDSIGHIISTLSSVVRSDDLQLVARSIVLSFIDKKCGDLLKTCFQLRIDSAGMYPYFQFPLRFQCRTGPRLFGGAATIGFRLQRFIVIAYCPSMHVFSSVSAILTAYRPSYNQTLLHC